MHKIEVGQLYRETRTSWPEVVEWNWSINLNELRLFFRDPRPQEIQAVKIGATDFGLTIKGDIIFLAFRFQGAQKGQAGIPWSDAPYSYHMVPDDRKGLPDDLSSPTAKSLLQIVLVNASTGITLAIRVVSLSHEFTQQMYRAIREQAEKPFNQTAYDRQLQRIYATQDSKKIYNDAIVKCVGGD